MFSLVVCLILVFVSSKTPDFKLSAKNLNPAAKQDEEYSIYSFFENQANNKKVESSSSLKDKEQVYEAYTLLHTLAQDFHKPFDSPAVIVVGYQSSGKSALIEALMGFQFNQVSIFNHWKCLDVVFWAQLEVYMSFIHTQIWIIIVTSGWRWHEDQTPHRTADAI